VREEGRKGMTLVSVKRAPACRDGGRYTSNKTGKVLVPCTTDWDRKEMGLWWWWWWWWWWEGKEREFLDGKRGTLELARGDMEIVFVRDGEVGVGWGDSFIRWEREEREKRGVWEVIGGEMGYHREVAGRSLLGVWGDEGGFGGRLSLSTEGKINKRWFKDRMLMSDFWNRYLHLRCSELHLQGRR